jgi:hypothetical protein
METYIGLVIEEPFNIERIGERHQYFFFIIGFFDGPDGSFPFFVLIECKSKLIQRLP